MEMVPLEPTIGVEIRGVQMAEADGDTLDAIRRAVWEHGIAVFRDQSLTPEQHIALPNAGAGSTSTIISRCTKRSPKLRS